MTDVSCTSILENRSAGTVTHILATLPPPPAKSHRTGSLSSASAVAKQSSVVLESEVSPSHQPPSQPTSLIIAPSSKVSDSPCSSPTDPVTISPRSSISLSTDKSWSFFQKDGTLGWTNFEEHHHLLGADEDNSERHSSDDDADVWSITDEQLEYYFNQFKTMQPDIKKKISGATAKEFFEKSKLPLIELSKIWQLSDVDKDGALSIDEFCTAMHLVVLRRNNIELPDVLPASLVPKIPKTSEDDVNIPNATTTTTAVQPPQSQIVNSPKQTSPSELVSPQSKEWTKFNDSPTSSLSSPGMKPVNFDFSAASVEQDPKILHPVALRLSPDKQVAYSSNPEKEPTGPSNASQPSDVNPDLMNGPVHSSSFSGTSSEPSKSLVSSSSATTTATSNLPQGPKKEPPPPPPPRPKHNHIRSSSLDLNKLGKTVPHFLGTPPAVPPRVSPSGATPHKSSTHSDEQKADAVDFADFANFEACDSDNLHIKSGAFEIYKKPTSVSQDGLQAANTSTDSRSFLLDQIPTPTATTDDSTALLVDIAHSESGTEESGAERKRHPSAPPLAIAAATINVVPHDKRELLAAIKAHRERNMMLTLLNSELNQELAEIMEERIALEIQLEQMKPFS